MNLLEIDQELIFLELALNTIEPIFKTKNDEIKRMIQEKEDALSSGLCEEAEFIAGIGFTICQKYITGTLGLIRVEKESALKIGPLFSEKLPYAQIINAAANYWKHHDEWDATSFGGADEDGLSSLTIRDASKISNQAHRTIKILQQVTAWSDYTCVNTLHEITKETEISLLSLIPILRQWRAELLNLYLRAEIENSGIA